MIAYLSGTVGKKFERRLTVMTSQGVGYLVQVKSSFFQSEEEGSPIELFIHTHVSENNMSLYGLETEEELLFFQQLISVTGIGAKTAMNILETPLPALKNALLKEDLATLSGIPGIGKKTASRMMLELKGKIIAEPLSSSRQYNTAEEEALEALLQLGYEKGRILRFFLESEESFEAGEELVKRFLQRA